jgi:hypothetical protein
MILKNRKPKHLLKELEILEVSLVDKPANEGAKVVLWKRDTSKALPDPSNALAAWSEVLGSEEGQELLGLIAKGDQSIFEGVENQDVSNLADFLETADGGVFLEALSKQLKKGGIVSNEMTVVEKIKKKSFDSQIEASNKLKLELTKLAPASDKRSPERRYVDYMKNNPDVQDAMFELPDVVVAEVAATRDFGPTHEVIRTKAKELFAKGVVPSVAHGFCKIMDEDGDLAVKFFKEQQV